MIKGFIKNPNPIVTSYKPPTYSSSTADFYGIRVGDTVILAKTPKIFNDSMGKVIEINRDYNEAWNEERKRMEQIKVKWANGTIDTHIVVELEVIPEPTTSREEIEDWYNYQ